MNGRWPGKSSIKETQRKERGEHGKPGKETSLNFHDSSYLHKVKSNESNEQCIDFVRPKSEASIYVLISLH